MKRGLVLIAFVTLAFSALSPAMALADSGTQTYQLHLELPNISEASNGDRVAVTGMGVFGVHPKSVTATGTFSHATSTAAVVASGTWAATELLEFQSYGCGVLTAPDPDVTLPPNFCGGVVRMRVLLTVTAPASIAGFQAEGILTVFCIVGPNPPNSHDDPSGEGITLVVPGIANFNKIVSGMNIYVRMS
jgi:hypothetical protein